VTESAAAHVARKNAVSFLESTTPARYDSPEADRVGQRRQRDQHYSACADLAHAMYEALGLRSSHVNRAPSWRSGLNVSLLSTWPGVALPEVDWTAVDGGDVLIRWSFANGTDAHVVCVMSPVIDGKINTAEYGQARPTIGRQFSRAVSGEGRPWQRWLPLPLVLEACQ
jgi:hypothetical protein